jgi:hypothetical protein
LDGDVRPGRDVIFYGPTKNVDLFLKSFLHFVRSVNECLPNYLDLLVPEGIELIVGYEGFYFFERDLTVNHRQHLPC